MTTAVLRSATAGIEWPALPGAAGAALLALLHQFEISECLSPESLADRQLVQLRHLLLHASNSVPYLRRRFAAAGFDPIADFDFADFRRLPVLTREEVRDAGAALYSAAVPAAHGAVLEHSTSGSTGVPLRYRYTAIHDHFMRALSLRDILWHERDLSLPFAAIRAHAARSERSGWGVAADAVFESGPAAMLDIATPIEVQVEWLVERDPGYLMTYGSNLGALARFCIERDIRLPRLRAVVSYSETVGPDLRALCRRAWDVPLQDIYSARETGTMALQCPSSERYHAMSEAMLVEVLDDAGRPVPAGAVGRVVVTPLHNFAMPLVRYAIGDHAIAGGKCPCGRGLPVLDRILGRTRNLVVHPDGRRPFPDIPGEVWFSVAPFRQFWLVQTRPDTIEVHYVLDEPLSASGLARVSAGLQRHLKHAFRFVPVHHRERRVSATGKYEAFVSLL